MKKFLTATCLFFASLFGAGEIFAQQENEIEEVAEAIEAIAEKFSDKADRFGKQIEVVLDENSDELEEWAEKYESQWEDWAEDLEERFESWAEHQEGIWEEWAQEYSHRWESWAEDLDEGEWEPEKVNRLIRRNLKMLGDMPLGDLVEGVIKEGTRGFESAPWESLSEIQNILQDSIERAVNETEARLERSKLLEAKSRARESEDDLEAEIDYILPVAENQREGVRAKEKALAVKAEGMLEKLGEKMAAGKATKKDVAELMKLIDLQNQQRKKAEFEKAKKRSKTETLKRKSDSRIKNREREQRARVENARREAEKRLSDSLQRVREREESRNDDREGTRRARLVEVLKSLQREEDKIKQKNQELEDLRKEIQRLRKDVESLNKGGGK